jgi:integrase
MSAAENIISQRDLLIHARTAGEKRTPGVAIKVGTAVARLFEVREKGRASRWELRFAKATGFKTLAGLDKYRTVRIKITGTDRTPLTKADARGRAQALLGEIAAGRSIGSGLTVGDQQCYVRLVERLELHRQRTGTTDHAEVTLSRHCTASERAHQLGATLDQLIQHWEKTNVTDVRRTMDEAVNEFLAEVEARSLAQKSTLCHWRTLKSRLNAVAKAFPGEVHALDAAAVEHYLKKLGLKPKTINHYRAAIVEFLGFALLKHYCSRQLKEAVAAIKPYKLTKRTATPYTAAELKKILDYAERKAAKHVPRIALTAFGGARVNEAAKMDWADIDLKRKRIVVRAEIAKKRLKRYLHCSDNLVAWLKPYEKKEGPICPVKYPSEAFTRICVNAEAPRKMNGERSGFINHRLDQTNDYKLTAREAGTSVDKIETNYFDLQDPGDADAWFSIFPSGGQLRLSLK